MRHKKKIVVLSGAGISAESGIATFRDANGLWEGHDIMEVASPDGFRNNPQLVLDFYNLRRRQLLTVAPNAAHYALTDLEKDFDVTIITQNVDNLHERAGSTKVIHLHGELLKAKSTQNEEIIIDWDKDQLGRFSTRWRTVTPSYCMVWRVGAYHRTSNVFFPAGRHCDGRGYIATSVSCRWIDGLCPK